MKKVVPFFIAAPFLFFSFSIHCPVGLYNLGNTCYMNSVLQALFASRALAKAFNLNLDRGDSNFVVDRQYQYLSQLRADKVDNRIRPESFKNMVLEDTCKFPPRLQQDASEFLTKFISVLSEKFQNLFYFTTRNYIVCESGDTSYIDASNNQLFLPLPSQNTPVTFDELFQKFYEVESYEEQNRPNCSSNAHKKAVENYMKILTIPEVLIIIPKRFDGRRNKIGTAIETPVAHLSIDTEAGGKVDYRLFACVIHLGSTPESGHYTSVVRYDEQWYLCDDSQVTDISFDEAKDHMEGRKRGQGYIYFFERVSGKSAEPVKNEDFVEINVQLNDLTRSMSELYFGLLLKDAV